MIGRRSRLQLDGPADRPLGLIEAVESREIVGEPVVPVGPQRLGGERLPRKLDRRLHLTERRELVPRQNFASASFGASASARRYSASAPRQSKSAI